MPAPDYLASSRATRGFSSDETGIKIESFEQSFTSAKDYLLDKNGGVADVAVNFDPRAQYSIAGDVLASTGLLATTCNFAETWDDHIDQTVTSTAFQQDNATAWDGGLYLNEGTISEGREQWKAVSASFEQITTIS